MKAQPVNVPDIERAACTMLALHLKQGDFGNPTVVALVEAVIGGETVSIERLNADRETAKAALREGPEQPEGEDEVTLRWLRFRHAMDEAALRLVSGIVIFQDDGRPEGDRVVDLGFGVGFSTSLAAKVVEFHLAAINALYARA